MNREILKIPNLCLPCGLSRKGGVPAKTTLRKAKPLQRWGRNDTSLKRLISPYDLNMWFFLGGPFAYLNLV